MFNVLNSFMSRYHEYATRAARKQAHQVLSRQSDWLLADAGFSRALLEQGVKAWPWREKTALVQAGPPDVSVDAVNQAVRELHAYSDAELADLGISRGSIVEAVRHGRPGVELDEALRAA